MSNFRPAAVDRSALVKVRHDMEVFDSLPPILRQALANAPVPYASGHALALSRNMAPEYVASIIGATR